MTEKKKHEHEEEIDENKTETVATSNGVSENASSDVEQLSAEIGSLKKQLAEVELSLGFRSSFNASAPAPNYLEYYDADHNGTVDLNDLQQFRVRFNGTVVTAAPPPSFYVNPATGDDGNDGRSPTTAWPRSFVTSTRTRRRASSSTPTASS